MDQLEHLRGRDVNGHAATAVFTQSVASDHVIHRGTVSVGGLGGSANRNLGDLFQWLRPAPPHQPRVLRRSQGEPPRARQRRDNPSTRRLIRANFTHQLSASAGIVTKGQCAQGLDDFDDVEGEGQLEQDDDDFGMIGRTTPVTARSGTGPESGDRGAQLERDQLAHAGGELRDPRGSAKVERERGLHLCEPPGATWEPPAPGKDTSRSM